MTGAPLYYAVVFRLGTGKVGALKTLHRTAATAKAFATKMVRSGRAVQAEVVIVDVNACLPLNAPTDHEASFVLAEEKMLYWGAILDRLEKTRRGEIEQDLEQGKLL